MLQYGKSVTVHIKSTVADLTHETDMVIPLPFVFNEFDILTKCEDSIQGG
jgi:hypothetical protein